MLKIPRLRCMIAAALLLFAAVAVGFDEPAPSQLRQLAFHHDSLWWGSVSRSIDKLPEGIRADLRSDLERLGVRPEHAQIDVRSGRWTTLIITRPLIPGTGVGNSLSWDDLGRAQPDSLHERESAVWEAFAGFLSEQRNELGFDRSEFGHPTVSLHGGYGERLIQIHLGRQFSGIPVRDSDITAAINSGNLVLMGQRNWADIDLDPQPRLGAEIARQALQTHLGGLVPDRDREPPHLVIVPVADEANDDLIRDFGRGLDFRLVWVFSPHFDFDIGTWEALVDAHSGELLSFEDLNHYAQQRSVRGGKFPVANDGLPPDGVEQDGFPMPFADIRVGGTQIGFATSGGVVPEAAGSDPISTTLTGQYVRINDNCGAVNESTEDGDLDLGVGTGSATNCQVQPGSSAGNTRSARTAFYGLNRIQEQARGYLPNNQWVTQRLTSNMNVNNTCNATWNGTAVSFFRAGNGCSNTGELMPVVHHEWGHGMDANDGNPGVSRPGEGIADIFAQNMLVDSCIGRNFRAMQCTGFGDPCLSCTGVRESDWARQASGLPHDIDWILSPISAPGGGCIGTPTSNRSPCGNSVHCEGSIIAEALWDLIHRDLRGFDGSAFDFDLNTALELGTRLTYLGSYVVGSWFQCNPGSGVGNGCNASGGYLNYLAADDDNGDLTDGTPHMSAIFAAFDRHGLACDTLTVQDSGCAGRPASAPDNIVAVGLDGMAGLTWDPVPDAEEYWVFRSESVKGCDFGKALVGRTTQTSFLETGLRNDFGLLYNVMAVGAQDSCSGPMSPCIEVIPSQGPSGQLVGTVTHRTTGEALAAIQIEALGADNVVFGTLTSESGAFSLNLPVGSYQVEVSAAGFQSEQFAIEIAEDQVLETDPSLDAPVLVAAPETYAFRLASGQNAEGLLGLANPSGQVLEWGLFADSRALELQRAADPALEEVLELPGFQISSAPNGGSPVVIELPAGIATRGEVLGFRFQGTVEGVSGNQTWASDMCMVVESPDGQTFGVGGFSSSLAGCTDNNWGFSGNQSSSNGTYQSNHAAVFAPPAPDDGTWRFTFVHDWNSAAAATMNWSDVSITLVKQPLPICSGVGDIEWLSVIDDAGSTPAIGLALARFLVEGAALSAGQYEADLCVASNDPLRPLLPVPVTVEVVEGISPAQLGLSADSLDFGEVRPGFGAELALTISNEAEAGALMLELVVPLFEGDAGFEMSGGDCQFPSQLAPGESCTLGLRFAPGAVDDFAATLWIVSGSGQPGEVGLSGLGRIPDPVFFDSFREEVAAPTVD